MEYIVKQFNSEDEENKESQNNVVDPVCYSKFLKELERKNLKEVLN